MRPHIRERAAHGAAPAGPLVGASVRLGRAWLHLADPPCALKPSAWIEAATTDAAQVAALMARGGGGQAVERW